MFKHAIAAMILLLFLMNGCIVDKDVSAHTTERVLSIGPRDLNMDNETDFKTYVFRPILVSAEANITLQKTAVAAMTGTYIEINRTNDLTDANVGELETKLFEFDNDRKEKELACKDALGLSRGIGTTCGSADECADLCTTTACKKFDSSSRLVGYWIYQFSLEDSALDQDITDAKDALVTLKGATPDQKEWMMRKLNSIMDHTLAINANPLMNDNMFGICGPISYDAERLNDMMGILGSYNRVPVKYSYAVNLKATVRSKDYTELKLTDTLPPTMTANLTDIAVPQGNPYDALNNTISWAPIKSSIYSDYTLGYGFQTTQGMREDIFDNWPTPSASIQVISFTNNPVVEGIVNISKSIYSASKGFGYYTALGIIIGFWAGAISALLLLLKVLVALVRTMSSGAPLRDTLILTYGRANIYWKAYLLATVVFILAGYGLMLGALSISEDSLRLENIVRHLAESIPGTLSMIFFFLAIYLLYSLVEDKVKGSLAGRAYYENMLEISPRTNEIRLRKLKEKMAELDDRISHAGTLDVSEEKSIIVSVPLGRMEVLIKTKGSEKAAKELIDMYAYKIESAILHIDEKARIFKEYGEEWSRHIAEKLAEKDSVPFSSLSGIPAEWRTRAATHFALENEEEGYIVDSEGIKRIASSPEKKAEELLKKLISKDLAIGGAVFRNSAALAVQSDSGNKSVEAILSWKVCNYGKTLGQKALNSECQSITIVGEKNTVIATKVREAEGVIFARKDKAEQALADFEARLKKL